MKVGKVVNVCMLTNAPILEWICSHLSLPIALWFSLNFFPLWRSEGKQVQFKLSGLKYRGGNSTLSCPHLTPQCMWVSVWVCVCEWVWVWESTIQAWSLSWRYIENEWKHPLQKALSLELSATLTCSYIAVKTKLALDLKSHATEQHVFFVFTVNFPH